MTIECSMSRPGSCHDKARAERFFWSVTHESIDTTLRYYVGTDAQRTADAAWAAFERSTGPFLTPAPNGAPNGGPSTPSGGGRRRAAKG